MYPHSRPSQIEYSERPESEVARLGHDFQAATRTVKSSLTPCTPSPRVFLIGAPWHNHLAWIDRKPSQGQIEQHVGRGRECLQALLRACDEHRTRRSAHEGQGLAGRRALGGHAAPMLCPVYCDAGCHWANLCRRATRQGGKGCPLGIAISCRFFPFLVLACTESLEQD